MDRELDVSFRRRRLARRVAGAVVAVGLVAAVLLLLPGWLRPSIARDQVRTATVERGAVEATITAAGMVTPARERVLSSPVEARVVRVLKRPGSPVRQGEEVLELDTSAARLDLERLEDRLGSKANEQEQARLDLERQLASLRGQVEAQRLDAEALEARAEQSRKLRAEGLMSEQSLRAAEVEAKKARIVLQQLAESMAVERRATDARLRGLALDLATLRKERAEARRLLELATARADRAGVVTWVVSEEGAMVRRGDVLARVADLGSFRVEASASDVHSSRLAPGLPARVEVDGEEIPGRVASVDPTIAEGTVRFLVDLAAPSHPRLRNNLRVDVLVATGQKGATLRVQKGPALEGGRPVFVVDPRGGGRLVRREVRLGLTGAAHVEVLSGLAAGEEVVLSDLSDYAHAQTIELR